MNIDFISFKKKYFLFLINKFNEKMITVFSDLYFYQLEFNKYNIYNKWIN